MKYVDGENSLEGDHNVSSGCLYAHLKEEYFLIVWYNLGFASEMDKLCPQLERTG
jgi:hypothetical protein